MKITIFEANPREADAFATLNGDHNVIVSEHSLQAENVRAFADSDVISTFIYSELDRQVLEQLGAVRLIATRSTGYDHIDMEYCARRNIIVCNVPTYGENTVAEHVFALLLAISHRLRDAMERAQSGWFSPAGLEGFDLQGKRLGVVGTGSIGRHVIRIAKGFQMEVVASDIRPDRHLAKAFGFRYVALDELLAQSDIVTLHVPRSTRTDGLIDAQALHIMRPGAILINTVRGSIVDVIALVQALRSGKISAAGLDVLPDEPLIREEAELISSAFSGQHDLRNLVADHVLLHMPNVVVTPHSAFNTREAAARIIATTIDNIRSFAAGRPQNRVE